MKLNVLLVEDNAEDMTQLVDQITTTFQDCGYTINLDQRHTFEDGLEAIHAENVRYDVVISDTYRGKVGNKDAAVLQLISEYKKGKFCPLIICSSGTQPTAIEVTPFLGWADKAQPDELDKAIGDLLEKGIPQLSKSLHDEIDNTAGQFLWGFLEQNWEELENDSLLKKEHIERIVRRRAAIAISELSPGEYSSVGNKFGLEYYVYPSLDHSYYSLGDIIKCEDDIRVILTPHCHLFTHPGQERPRAEFVLTIKTISVHDVLGGRVVNAKDLELPQKIKKLGNWANSPAQTDKPPKGRHWYLPKFLKIPHLYCDFLQVESIPYDDLGEKYTRLATLTPPYAEALQECFSKFYGSVGIPKIDENSILDLINDAPNPT